MLEEDETSLLSFAHSVLLKFLHHVFPGSTIRTEKILAKRKQRPCLVVAQFEIYRGSATV
jgi:hypothetical protein